MIMRRLAASEGKHRMDNWLLTSRQHIIVNMTTIGLGNMSGVWVWSPFSMMTTVH